MRGENCGQVFLVGQGSVNIAMPIKSTVNNNYQPHYPSYRIYMERIQNKTENMKIQVLFLLQKQPKKKNKKPSLQRINATVL